MLVDTSHPGNIGATARAMKTMGLGDLALVRPKHFPSDEATARAAGADDVLASARVHDDARERDRRLRLGRRRERAACAPSRCRSSIRARRPTTIWQRLPGEPRRRALGPEQSGLTNDDLARCQQLVHIPANPEFSSLNLAMAVQVLCYELRMAAPSRPPPERPRQRWRGSRRPPSSKGLHEHLERLLTESEFLHPEHQRQVKLKLRRIFHKATLEQNEINILRGALTSLDPGKRRTRAPR